MKIRSIITLLILVGVFIGCKKDDKSSNDIMARLKADAQFSTLVGALESAGLDATLKGSGTFTVFAPTNEAFAKLPSGLTSAQVTAILTYHVLAETKTAAQVTADTLARFVTLQGEYLYFDNRNANNISINGNASLSAAITGSHGHAGFVQTNIDADNGVIHKINNILLPDAFLDIVEVAAKRYSVSRAAGAVAFAGLATAASPLRGAGPVTLFAPLNPPNPYDADAFQIVDGAGINLTTPENAELLTGTLYTHVTAGDIASTTLAGQSTITMLSQVPLNVVVNNGVVLLRSAMIPDSPQTQIFFSAVVEADIIAKNGRVHFINNLILPQVPS
jgi:transforming growth factor-beta-induced protein